MNHRLKLTLSTCFLVFFGRIIQHFSYRQHNPHRNKPPCYHKFTGLIALKVHRISLINTFVPVFCTNNKF